MNNAHKELLKENYKKACNDYVRALLTLWGVDYRYGYWVGGDVGGVYDCDGWIFLNMQDVVCCVENGVTSEEYEQWQDYCVKCAEYDLPIPNLNAWHKGAPKHDFTKLDALKKDLDNTIEEYKENTNTTLDF